MNNFYASQAGNGFNGPWWMYSFFPLVIIVALWSVFWKGLGLWHASRRGDVAWFIAMLVINLFGVVEIVYLFGIARLKFADLFRKKQVHSNAE